MNDNYWAEFYDTFRRTKPSDFAVWAEPRITGGLVYDFGCGDAADLRYFLANGHTIVGIDPQYMHNYTAENYMGSHWCRPDDTVYARWFLHAVEQSVEDQLLEWTQGQLLVEARVVGDSLDDTHYRRPLNPEVFVPKLYNLGYTIHYFEVSRSFSPGFAEDSPLLFRLNATRKGVLVTSTLPHN